MHVFDIRPLIATMVQDNACFFKVGRHPMAKRAQDIVELERMRHDGASFDELSEKAIKVFDRIGRDDRQFRGQRNPVLVQQVRDHKKDFKEVIAEIKRARGDAALHKFTIHERGRKQRLP